MLGQPVAGNVDGPEGDSDAAKVPAAQKVHRRSVTAVAAAAKYLPAGHVALTGVVQRVAVLPEGDDEAPEKKPVLRHEAHVTSEELLPAAA